MGDIFRLSKWDSGRHCLEARVEGCLMTFGYSMELGKGLLFVLHSALPALTVSTQVWTRESDFLYSKSRGN